MSKQLWADVVAVAGMVLFFGIGLGSAAQESSPGQPHVIEVVAKRFAFEPATIEVTEGERVRLMVRSADGVHGLEIKKFDVNELIPRGGKPVAIEFVASAPGTYPIVCSEECGDGHDSMKGRLVVLARPRK